MKRKGMLIVFILSFFVSACAGNIDKTRTTELNNYSESTIKEKLIIGSTTKKDTLIILGVPSSPKNYNNSSEWIYKSDQVDRRIYFFIPFNNDKNQLLTLRFDEMGVLSSLKYTDKASKGTFKYL